MGTLYIIPTPVGNMEDMTLRAIRILKEADVVLAEDTRTSGNLLRHFDIKNHLLAHHKFNEHGTTAGIVERLKAGQTVALVSDAGTPGISDPGFYLSREAANAGVEVVCLPGATACIPAIVASGLPCDRFCFEGFLPQKKGRQTMLVAARRDTHDDILRVALPSTQDAPAVCRSLRRRPPGERGARDIQAPRAARARYSGRGHRPFHREFATRRVCYSSGW